MNTEQTAEIVKAATGFTAGLGISKIVSGIINTNVPVNNKYEKVVIFVGGFAIKMVIGDIVQNTINQKVDATVEWLEQTKNIPVTPKKA